MSQTEPRVDDMLCHALYSATQAIVQLYRDLLAPWGLTYQQVMVLGLLWQRECLTPGEIADTLYLDSSSVAGLLKRLQQAGLIERDVDPSDRRRVQVRPTERGQEIRGELGWIEECITRAYGMNDAAATDLLSRLHEVRARINEFPRNDRGEASVVA